MRNKFLAKIVGAATAFAMAVGISAVFKDNSRVVAESPASLTFAAACGGSGIDSDGNEWTITSDAAESTYDNTKGIHYGTGKVAVSYLNLSTSDISETITQIAVNASGASGTTAVLNVTVDGDAFDIEKSLTSSASTYTFNGSASGEIIVSLTQTSQTKALYCKSISVTYSTGGIITYTVSYDANGGEGTMTDPDSPYNASATVTVMDNEFTRSGYAFSHWDTNEDDSGDDYDEGDTFTINTNVTLYAQWDRVLGDLTGETGTINFGSADGSLNVNGASKSAEDDLGVKWTVTTDGTDSFTPNSAYAQIGSGSKPASSITFETDTLGNTYKVTSFSAKFGGFSGTAGDITLKVGDTTVGTRTLNTSSDVTVTKDSVAKGSTLSVTVNNIEKGVKVYFISYTLASPIDEQTITASADSAYSDETITLTTNAATAAWSITANTAEASLSVANGKSTVLSAGQPGSVTVQAVSDGYTNASKTLVFNERPAGTFYDVTFDSDGGSESPDPMSIKEGETFEFPSPGTKDHYSFDGWTSDLVDYYQPGDTSPAVTEDIEYLGFWTKDPTYVVTYSAGSNGSGSFADDGDNFAGDYTLLPFNSLTGVSAEDGYRFKDYTVNDVHKNPGDTISLSSATTVTVNFEKTPLEYAVTFGTADGSAGLSDFNNTSYVIPSGVTLDNIQGNIYGKNDNTAAAIRFGKSGTTGSFDVTINSDYYIVKVVANLKYYGTDTTAEFAVTPDGGDAINKTLTSSFADYEYDVSNSYVSKVTLGTTINGKRAYLSGFTITYAVRAKNTIENSLTTNASLTYRYSKVEEEFTYSEVAIRFGGFMSKDLWDRVDLESTIQGYGVIVSTADYLDGLEIKDLYDIAIDGHTIDEALAELCDGTNIRKYSKTSAEKANPDLANNDQKTAHGVELSEDYYVWNLYLRLSSLYYKTSFTAVAYVRTAKNGIVFLNETTASVKSLATDLIAGPNYDEDSLEGSLDHLAKL